MDRIAQNTLTAGDIILYHGDGWISKAIQFFDGTEMNHAAIFLGDGQVGEAKAKGLDKSGFQDSLAGAKYAVSRRLVSHPGSMRPVLAKAETYLAGRNRYAYEQIVLLALLGLTRNVPVNVYLKWLLRKILDDAGEFLMLAGKRQPMICSEFVYRCYAEARRPPGNPYALDINPFPVRPLARAAALRSLAERRPHYSGVHPGSPLAWALEVMANQVKPASKALAKSFERYPEMPGAASGPAKEEKKMAAMRLNELIEKYLSEAKNPPPALFTGPSFKSPEMLSSIRKFAEAYAGAAGKPATEKTRLWSESAMAGEIPAVLDNLLQTVADFVTPGDLYNCKNLYSVGEIRP
ncbi:MAG: hypothetical protein A2X28_01230 [Elusimicrobia bacterium GWA2_56_46]|nr:MAG: hypothetical protein A2X28_01230 [Elusimicrobia bacterium GWA2_56_46]OGR53972.1 MAG: hypothetical protein A2X39_09740 [Elusimicrobia bacterium GWC2_56_31]HBW22080.1 hypothetical protein [Elusimicrobiota bacterium]